MFMNPQYLGIDIGGAKNTWMCALKSSGSKLYIAQQPTPTSLEQIVQYAEEHLVVAVAIDAQLT